MSQKSHDQIAAEVLVQIRATQIEMKEAMDGLVEKVDKHDRLYNLVGGGWSRVTSVIWAIITALAIGWVMHIQDSKRQADNQEIMRVIQQLAAKR